MTRPYIQLMGYALEPLTSVSYCLTNALSTNTDQQGVVLRQHFDQASGDFTTNWFQCYDLDLAPGVNKVFLRLADLAGNVSIRQLNYVLDYSSVTAPPLITALWPTNGAVIAADTVSLRGHLDDPTATLRASLIVNGEPVEVEGIVERTGLFWLDALPLNAGNNQITLTVSNAAGLTAATTINMSRSAVTIVVDAVPDSQLHQPKVAVTGTISETSSPGYAVWVNGVKATVNANGTWLANDVPLNDGGMATLHAAAIPNSENGGNGTPPDDPGLTNVRSPNPTCSGCPVSAVDQERPAELRRQLYYCLGSNSGGWDPCEPATDNDYHNQAFGVIWTPQGGAYANNVFVNWCDHSTTPDTYRVDPWHLEIQWDSALNATSREVDIVSGLWGPWGSYAPDVPWFGPDLPWEGLGRQIFPPGLGAPWEHCDLEMRGEFAGMAGASSRRARTVIALHTGGRSVAHSDLNLFVISGSAIQEIPWSTAAQPFPVYAINPEQIRIGSLGHLGGDGRLYKVLANNQQIDASPRVDTVDGFTSKDFVSKHKVALQEGVTNYSVTV